MAQIMLNYSAAQINAAVARINSLVSVIEENIVQLYDDSTAIYPRTKAEAVFFDNDTSKTLDQQFSQLEQEQINLHILKANNLRIKHSYILTTNKSVGDYIYYGDLQSDTFWNCDIFRMLKGDILKINLSFLGSDVSKLLLVTKDSSLAYNRYVVIAAQNLQLGMNTITVTENCYAIVSLLNDGNDDSYIKIENSSITSNTLFSRDYTDNLLKKNSVLSVEYESGYYDRNGVRQSSTAHSTTGKLSVDELNLSVPFNITLADFSPQDSSVFSNVVIWLKDGSVSTYNVSTMNHYIVDDNAEYIAFCDSNENLSTHKIYIEEDWQYRVDYRLKNIENEITTDIKNINEVISNYTIYKDYTHPLSYIINNSSAVVGSVYNPVFESNEHWSSNVIKVFKGDTIIINDLEPMIPDFSPKIIFTDDNGIVVNPTMDLTNHITSLTLTVQFDGFLIYTANLSYDTFIKILHSGEQNIINYFYDRINAVSVYEEYINVTHYIDCPISRSTDIFLDGVIRVEDDVKLTPIRTTGDSVQKIGELHLRLTPTTETTNKSVNITKYQDIEMSVVNCQKTTIFRPVSISNGDGTTIKNICISGDSLIDGTNSPCEAFRLLNEDGDFVIHQIGTRNAYMDNITYKHEGRGSWSWSTYLDTRYGVYTDEKHETTSFDGKLNAFMIDEDLNFQKYMQRNFPNEVAAGRGIDIFVMALGTNDVTQGSEFLSDQDAQNIINRAKNFIDVLLSQDKGYPNCKVVIGLPGVGAPSFPGTGTSSNVFKMSIMKLNKWYIETFDNGKYNANVTCVMHGCYIDRFNGYQHYDVGNNEYINDNQLETYITQVLSDPNISQSIKNVLEYMANNFISANKTRQFTDSVHPLPIGYKQWGRGIYGKIRALLNGLL